MRLEGNLSWKWPETNTKEGAGLLPCIQASHGLLDPASAGQDSRSYRRGAFVVQQLLTSPCSKSPFWLLASRCLYHTNHRCNWTWLLSHAGTKRWHTLTGAVLGQWDRDAQVKLSTGGLSCSFLSICSEEKDLPFHGDHPNSFQFLPFEWIIHVMFAEPKPC